MLGISVHEFRGERIARERIYVTEPWTAPSGERHGARPPSLSDRTFSRFPVAECESAGMPVVGTPDDAGAPRSAAVTHGAAPAVPFGVTRELIGDSSVRAPSTDRGMAARSFTRGTRGRLLQDHAWRSSAGGRYGSGRRSPDVDRRLPSHGRRSVANQVGAGMGAILVRRARSARRGRRIGTVADRRFPRETPRWVHRHRPRVVCVHEHAAGPSPRARRRRRRRVVRRLPRALDLDVERLDQRYHRVAADGETTRRRFHYSAPRFDYHDYLVYDSHGLVLHYPDIATRIL